MDPLQAKSSPVDRAVIWAWLIGLLVTFFAGLPFLAWLATSPRTFIGRWVMGKEKKTTRRRDKD